MNANTIDVPSYVKQANALDITGSEELSQGLFADPGNRRWPFHTKAAVWTSARQLAAIPSASSVYVDRIKTAAQVYGIRSDVDALFNSIDKKEEQVNTPYGLTVIDNNDQPLNLFPLRNPTEIQKAAQYLLDYRQQIHLGDRQQFAENIIKQAQVHNIEFDLTTMDFLNKQAGEGDCSTGALKEAVYTRIHLVGKDEQDSLRKLAAAIMGPTTRTARKKIAAVLDSIDRDYNLTSVVEPPEDVLFAVTPQSQQILDQHYIRLSNGEAFSKSAAQQLTESEITTWMGSDVASQVCDPLNGVDVEQLAKLASTFDENAVQRFTGLMKRCTNR